MMPARTRAVEPAAHPAPGQPRGRRTALLCALRCLCVVLLGNLLAGCIDSYTPDAISTTRRYLVVDGFINTQGITHIRLSRTYNLTGSAPPPETRATVAIEEEGGPRYVLQETTPGTYQSASLALTAGRRYQLRIVTLQGKPYASDYAVAKTTPPIDNIAWRADASTVGLYLNSQDPAGQTRYYRWDYEETWESRPQLYPNIQYLNGRLQRLTPAYPVVCWVTEKSTAITLSKTTNLTQDVVSNFLLRSHARNSFRFHGKYSILVRQYAQSQEEYAYWELLKRNTENIGTLFDPLPSQLTGNIRCLTDDDELALGYIGAHSVAEKRIFISRADLPPTRFLTGYEACIPPDTLRASLDQSLADKIAAAFVPGSNLVPVTEVTNGVVASTRDCVDCRRRGTDVRPSFWQ